MRVDETTAVPEAADVVVVGAGLAGLTAAATAARTGAQVVLVEPHRHGGRARSDDRDGFTLNLGPHALYEGGPAMAVLAALGVEVPGAYPSDLSGQRLLVDGRVVQAPVSTGTLLRSRAVGLRAKVGLAKVLAAAQRVDPTTLADVTVGEWFDGFGLTGTARRVAEAFVRLTTYCSAPDLLAAEAFVGQIRLGGVRYLDGGWQSMVDGLAAAGRAAGVRVVAARVTAVRSGADGAVVELDGDRSIRAGAVVLAVGSPEATARLAGLGGDWVATAGPAMELSCLDVGLRRPVDPWFLLGVDEPLYLAQHAPPAGLAPEGMATLALARYHAPGEALPAAEVRAQLWAHAARVGVAAEDVVTDRYLHRMVAVHGIPLATRGGLAGRPAVELPGRPGCFVAGDFVGAEGLLADASFSSGATAGRLAAARRLAVAA